MKKSKKFEKRDIEDIMSLTPLQEGMLFHYLKDPQSGYYFEQLTLMLSGEIRLERFQQAWNAVIQDNGMLRTVFRWEEVETPVQMVLKRHSLQFRYIELAGDGNGGGEQGLEAVKLEDRKSTFHLEEVPFRVTLCKLKGGKLKGGKIDGARHAMLVSNHHILLDGWSSGIVLKEFFDAYRSLSEGKGPIMGRKNGFKEFVQWHRNRDTGGGEAFWKDYLEGFHGPTELSVKEKGKSKDRGAVTAAACRGSFPAPLKERMDTFTSERKITLAVLLYAAWGLLLQRYNNTGDVVFGTTVSGRSAKVRGMEDMVGLFINTVPFRVRTHPAENTGGLLDRLNASLRHREEFEGDALVNIKSAAGQDYAGEMFDTLAVLENYPLDEAVGTARGPLKVESCSASELTHYDLTLTVTPSASVRWSLLYREGVLDKGVVEAMGRCFLTLLEDIAANPDKTAAELELLSTEDKQRILFDFNDTHSPFPGEKTVYGWFEEQVERTPDAVALKGYDRGRFPALSYRRLNQRANQLARVLRRKGVTVNRVTGVLLERSPDLVVGILAVLKAGGAYLPIDARNPRSRIEYMLEQGDVRLTVTGPGYRPLLGESHAVVDIEAGESYDPEVGNLPHVSGPGDLIYTIFTSGSTGAPKGAGVYHRGFMNLVHWSVTDFDLKEGDSTLLITSASFDLTQKNFYMPLVVGGTLCVPEGRYFDPVNIREWVAKERVTWLNCTPSMSYRLLEEEAAFKALESLRYLFLGGEPISMKMLTPWIESGYCGAQVVNNYGPTECTDICAFYRIREPGRFVDAPVPGGGPVPNTRMYVLDKDLNPLPLGVPGELCISGVGVGAGYINDRGLTEEKFASEWEIDPGLFSGAIRDGGLGEGGLYRTGDLVKRLPDGNIQFLGRMDFQVKVRGFRVELGEIQARLLTYPGVKDAVVTTVAGGGGEAGQALCAYLVPGQGKTAPDTTALREWLSRELPDYMLPSYFVELETMPLNPNGKVDRKALPAPSFAGRGETYCPPSGEVEETLCRLWAELLEIEAGHIGVADDFFKLGGHSLRATRLVFKINKHLGVRVPLAEVFERPTVSALAAYIRGLQPGRGDAIPPAPEKPAYPLSSAQMRLFFLSRMDNIDTAYNLPGALRVVGTPDKRRLEEAFLILIRRHETLRTAFTTREGKPVQVIRETCPFKIASMKAEAGDVQSVIREFIQPFDLGAAPLIRAALVELQRDEYLLLIDMHHIISDGVSSFILVKELSRAYEGLPLPGLEIQYKDFAHWQAGWFRSQAFKKQETYWLERFSGPSPVPRVNLPTSSPRPAVQDFTGRCVHFQLEKDLDAGLRELMTATDTTLFMVLLAAFNILLARYAEQEDIVVGSPVAGRNHPDVENVVGMFVNTLALRNRAAEHLPFDRFLAAVKETALGAYENQDYPFEELVNKLGIPRDVGRNPLFDVLFVSENLDIPELKLKDLTFKPYKFESTIAHLDLVFYFTERDGEIAMELEYAVSLFDAPFIDRMIAHFTEILGQVAGNPRVLLKDILLSHGLSAPDPGILLDEQVDFGF